MAVPEDAPRSEDGQYWWDGEQWQEIPADERSAPGATESEGSEGEGAETDGPSTAEAGWPPEGYPEDPAEWTKEQQDYYFGNLELYSWEEDGDGEVVAVLEIEDTDVMEA